MDNFISQEKVLYELAKAQVNKRFKTNYDYAILYGNILYITTSDVQPIVHGEWIEPDDDYGYFICSVCEERSPNDEKWNYCPNCGADMKGEK